MRRGQGGLRPFIPPSPAMSSKRAPPAPPTTIDDLDDGLLLRVLARVPPPARRRLPLVCRRWRRVCGNPTEELDSEVYLNFSSVRPPALLVLACAVAPSVPARGRSVPCLCCVIEFYFIVPCAAAGRH